MKKRRFKPRLDESQQMLFGLLLVFLLAISMLYCLGLASLVLRQTWESAPLPWDEGDFLEEELDLTITPVITPTGESPALPPQSLLMIQVTLGAAAPAEGRDTNTFDRSVPGGYNRLDRAASSPLKKGKQPWTLFPC